MIGEKKIHHLIPNVERKIISLNERTSGGAKKRFLDLFVKFTGKLKK